MGEIKVTDKRMFTADGELREQESAEVRVPAEPAEPPAESPAGPPSPAAPQSAPTEPVGRPQELGQPSFIDLVGLLVDPIAVYLGDVPMPDGSSREDLELARFQIDLLQVLSEKVEGNLSSQEEALLRDLIYRLRVRYVQKKG